MMNFKYYKLLILLLGLATIILGACTKKDNAEDGLAEIPKNVRVLALESTVIEEYFEVSGPVAPVRGADLSAQESGAVISLPLVKGDPVQEGELVLEQDRAILKVDMEAAKSSLATQDYNLDKMKQLFKAEKVSKMELLAAESTHAQAKGLAEISRKRYHRAGIKAPFAGVLADRYVELGELVMPGKRVVRVIDPYTLKMETHLTDGQIQWVTTGDHADILLGANPEPATGTVTWIGMEADRMTGKFKVELTIDNPDLHYNSGVIGRARLQKNISQSVLAVPRDAIVSGRAGPAVFIVVDSRASLHQVSLGRDQGLMVIVTNGVQVDDKIVVRGQRDLREGNLVNITETAANADGSLATDPLEVRDEGSGSRVPVSGSGSGQ